MIAREYNKRINLKLYTDQPDGYGGNTVVVDEQTSVWAKLVTSSSTVNQRATGLGLSDLYEPLLFKVRSLSGISYSGRTMSLVYQGYEYTIHSITDVDMFHREIEIFCTRNNPELIPTVDNQFNYTLPFQLA